MDYSEDLDFEDSRNRAATEEERRHWGTKNKWTHEEHARLMSLIGDKDGASIRWPAVASQLGTGRSAKQCRERWLNARPDAKKGDWSVEEEDILVKLHAEIGPCWSKMMYDHLHHRSENAIKNHWNSLIRCKTLNSRPETLLIVYVAFIRAGWPGGPDTLEHARALMEQRAADARPGEPPQPLTDAVADYSAARGVVTKPDLKAIGGSACEQFKGSQQQMGPSPVRKSAKSRSTPLAKAAASGVTLTKTSSSASQGETAGAAFGGTGVRNSMAGLLSELNHNPLTLYPPPESGLPPGAPPLDAHLPRMPAHGQLLPCGSAQVQGLVQGQGLVHGGEQLASQTQLQLVWHASGPHDPGRIWQQPRDMMRGEGQLPTGGVPLAPGSGGVSSSEATLAGRQGPAPVAMSTVQYGLAQSQPGIGISSAAIVGDRPSIGGSPQVVTLMNGQQVVYLQMAPGTEAAAPMLLPPLGAQSAPAVGQCMQAVSQPPPAIGYPVVASGQPAGQPAMATLQPAVAVGMPVAAGPGSSAGVPDSVGAVPAGTGQPTPQQAQASATEPAAVAVDATAEPAAQPVAGAVPAMQPSSSAITAEAAPAVAVAVPNTIPNTASAQPAADPQAPDLLPSAEATSETRPQPLCHCQQPALTNTSNLPDSAGRVYYTCSKAVGDAKRCRFFLWKGEASDDVTTGTGITTAPETRETDPEPPTKKPRVDKSSAPAVVDAGLQETAPDVTPVHAATGSGVPQQEPQQQQEEEKEKEEDRCHQAPETEPASNTPNMGHPAAALLSGPGNSTQQGAAPQGMPCSPPAEYVAQPQYCPQPYQAPLYPLPALTAPAGMQQPAHSTQQRVVLQPVPGQPGLWREVLMDVPSADTQPTAWQPAPSMQSAAPVYSQPVSLSGMSGPQSGVMMGFQQMPPGVAMSAPAPGMPMPMAMSTTMAPQPPQQQVVFSQPMQPTWNQGPTAALAGAPPTPGAQPYLSPGATIVYLPPGAAWPGAN